MNRKFSDEAICRSIAASIYHAYIRTYETPAYMHAINLDYTRTLLGGGREERLGASHDIVRTEYHITYVCTHTLAY